MNEFDLNRAVTRAIFAAEHSDYAGAKLWDEVERCEQALYDLLPKGSLESEIARRGIVSARRRAALLRSPAGANDGEPPTEPAPGEPR